MIEHAYDIELLTAPPDRGAEDHHGWCYGLPPGLTPEQWPLDPITCYPLNHGFTLLLPEDYRIHGPEIVALSFFATAIGDGTNDSVRTLPEAKEAILGEGDEISGDPDLAEFRRLVAGKHPRLHYMQDLEYNYFAVILLTQDEFDGPLCQPPILRDNRFRDRYQAPDWLEMGSGYAFFRLNGGLWDPECEKYLTRLFGEKPEKKPDWSRGLKWSRRASDPNAGKPPEEPAEGSRRVGYQSYFFWEDGIVDNDHFRIYDWAKDHKLDHIGGTMRPAQATPAFSPYYIGFEEYLGGYNFAGNGCAQLDFRDMKFDWAR